MENSLSCQEARDYILHAQRLDGLKQKSNVLDATLLNIEQLGYVQIDTICVVQRAHHHVLWARNPSYETSHLDSLVKDKKVFEYWSHAASYLPMSEYRFSLPRKQAILKGEQKFWFDKDEKLMNAVLQRISNEGPLRAKDFEHTGIKAKAWSSKPTKKALEYLYMQGDLMISSRVNFHKVYDLTQRVLPKDINATIPKEEEYIRFLIIKYLKANVLGQASHMAYLLKNTKNLLMNALNQMYENKELIQVNVQGDNYYALAGLYDLKVKPSDASSLKILSPFDNLLIQRKRMQKLFDFDYLLECYLPEAKRKYGYFSLPILWDGKLVARMDCKADKKESMLHIHNIVLEANINDIALFALALYQELNLFLVFNKCNDFVLHKSSPSHFKSIFQKLL